MRQLKYRFSCELQPGVVRTEWSEEEDMRLVEFLNAEGKDWVKARELFPGRT